MIKQIQLILVFLLLAITADAARIDRIEIKSEATNSAIKVVVIVPDVEKTQNCPVIYLLHGYMGNQELWLGIKPNLPEIADREGFIFVCPDGKNSWYINSPIDKNSQYETFISAELVDFIDKNYRTQTDRNYRAITGLSMGGHGALFNAMCHPDVFGATGSMSGAVDIHSINGDFGLIPLLGKLSEHPENWNKNSVMKQIATLKNGVLAIYIDCGVSDFLFEMSENLNKSLRQKGIDHDYTTRPGKHDADYWNNSIDYHILFFKKFFEKK